MPSKTSYHPQVTDVTGWTSELDVVHARIAPRFERAEPRRRALAYLHGLLSHVERKNGWQLAEEAGEQTPDGMQRLLHASHWDPDAVRADVVASIGAHLADPAAILVIDESGFLKKGTKSAGVQRQYSGTAGKKENCQIGVFVTYSSLVPVPSQVLVDRDLYLPKEWADDLLRRQEAGIPEEVPFATKPELARGMLERLSAADLPAAWVTGDTVYGGSGPLRHWLEDQRQPYVLAVASNDGVDVPWQGTHYHLPAGEMARHAVRAEQWQQLSAGHGSKGPRLYDWALVRLVPPQLSGFDQALLIRRPLDVSDDPEELAKKLAYYLIFAPKGPLVETLVAVAGRRWTIEESFAAAKGAVGLDHYEVRHYHGWYRHITLAMLALASLAVVRSRLTGSTAPEAKGGHLWLSSAS